MSRKEKIDRVTCKCRLTIIVSLTTTHTGKQALVTCKNFSAKVKERKAGKNNGSVVTKISSCRVNTTSTWGIKQLGISFGSIFRLFSYDSSQGPHS